MDAYFPFDPYLLRRSHVYISSMYNYWSGSRGAHSESSGSDAEQGWDLSDDDSDDASDATSEADVDSSDDSSAAAGAVLIKSKRSSRSRRKAAAAAAVLSDSEEMAVSMKLASSYINDSMSCTPASVSPARVGAHWGSMQSSSVSSRLDVAAAALDDFHEVVSAPPSPAVSEEASHRRASVRKGSIADEGW